VCVSYYLAAAANGLQNAMSSSYSANLIRTTHLTGTSTDIGIILGRVLRGNKQDLWKLFVLVGLAVSFTLGGLASFYAVQKWKEFSLLFNAGLFTLIGAGCVFYVWTQHDISIAQAATGTWSDEHTAEEMNHGLAKFTAGKISTSSFLLEMFVMCDRHEMVRSCPCLCGHRLGLQTLLRACSML